MAFLAVNKFKRSLYLLPVGIAVVMSYISSRYLFVGSGLNLIPWGLLALSWGLVARSKSEATRLGAVYGFAQAFIFLWIDKIGDTTVAQFLILMVIISALGLLAAVCAATAAHLSYLAKTRFTK